LGPPHRSGFSIIPSQTVAKPFNMSLKAKKVLPSMGLWGKDPVPTVPSKESPDAILSLAFSFWHSALLLNAVEMGIFTAISSAPNGRMNNDQIRDALELNDRAVPDLTDALVAIGLLERLGGFYCNSVAAERFLVKDKTSYIGDLLDSCSRRVYREMIDIEDALRDPSETFEDVGTLMEKHMREATLRSARQTKADDSDDNKSCASSSISDGGSMFDIDLSFVSIIKQAYEFYPSRILLAATEMGLFTMLEQAKGSKMTCQQISSALNAIEGRMKIFLRTLAAFKILTTKSEKGKDLTYSNSAATSTYLVKSKPNYLGGVLEMSSRYHYRYWSSISMALRTGIKQAEGKHGKTFSETVNQREGYEAYLESLGTIHAPAFRALAKALDFSKIKFMVDLGGGNGHLSSCVASEHKRVRCITGDLPSVQPLAERHVQACGLATRVKAVSVDFLQDALPSGVDMITMSMVMHERTPDERAMLIRKAYDTLPARDGVLVIIDYVLDERRRNEHGLFVSLNMLIETGSQGGSCFSHDDMDALCLQHGFRKTELIQLTNSCSAIVAHK
jgi:O-methyltransferase domain/Dimerisation domain